MPVIFRCAQCATETTYTLVDGEYGYAEVPQGWSDTMAGDFACSNRCRTDADLDWLEAVGRKVCPFSGHPIEGHVTQGNLFCPCLPLGHFFHVSGPLFSLHWMRSEAEPEGAPQAPDLDALRS